MGGLWDDARTGSPATVDVHVMHLRRKLGDAGRIASVRGVGFVLLV
jgi:DNA-binding response OmpR family regulator